jgi:hypothetical protein
VHLDDLLGDRKPSARAAFGPRVGVVDLLELLEDPRLMFHRDAWSGIGHTDGQVGVDRFGAHADLASVDASTTGDLTFLVNE